MSAGRSHAYKSTPAAFTCRVNRQGSFLQTKACARTTRHADMPRTSHIDRFSFSKYKAASQGGGWHSCVWSSPPKGQGNARGMGMDLAARIRHGVRAPYAWTFFFLTTFIVFSSFFLEGKVLLASSDHTFGHYPNILFGHRMLRQGDFGLWNPLIFGGVDFTSSFHHHMLHPLNWPLLLLPERFVLHGVSVQCYLELALIGIFAFRIIRRVQDDDLVALFIAVVAQLGGFAWFAATTLIGTHLLFAAAASIYVIVSYADRRPILNYLYLALCFFDILMMGHIAYISAFGLPVVVFFFWWTWPQSVLRPWRGLMPAVALAFVTAFCMSAVRLWPVMQGLLYEQAFVDTLKVNAGFKDAGYFALTGFVPEIFGLNLRDAQVYSASLDMGRWHTQFHNLSVLRHCADPADLVVGSAWIGAAVVWPGGNVSGHRADAVESVAAPQRPREYCLVSHSSFHHLPNGRHVPAVCGACAHPAISDARHGNRTRGLAAALVSGPRRNRPGELPRADRASGRSQAGRGAAGAVRFRAAVATKVLILAGLPACFVAVGRLEAGISPRPRG